MIEPIFFVYIFIAIFSYGVHSPLLVYCARKHNSVVVTVYRNLSYILTMLPLLFFVSISEIVNILQYLNLLLPAAFFAVGAFMLNMSAASFLPVSIGACFRHTTALVISLILGFFILNEQLTVIQLLLLGFLLITVLALTLIRKKHSHLDSNKTVIGIIMALFSGGFAATAFFFFSQLAQVVHPFVAGYFWEVAIGIFALAYMLMLSNIGIYTQKKTLPLKDTLQIALFSTPAILGTIFYGLAVNNGPYTLASGLSISAVAVGTVISWFLFNEKLTYKQLFLIGLILVIIFTIKVTS